MDRFTGIIDGTKSGWNKMDTKKRGTMITLLIGIILIGSILTYYTQKVNYVTLFRDLELQDAGNIVNDLETRKVAYKLENDSRDILVDEKMIGEYRLQLAMSGMMPENSTGFEIFDDIGLMVTDEDRKIMYQRALTGELQRSIMSLEAVNAAKVHLMMPEKSIFETEQKKASASVIIDLNPSQKFTDDMVRGIAALIAGAVDNLPEENIQVIDSKGNLLSSALQSGGNLSAIDVLDTYEKVRDDFEKKIEANLYELLGSAYGKEKIKVSVYADLDFDSEEITAITYENPVTRSDQISISGSNDNVELVTGGNIDDNISNVIGNEDGNNSTYERIVNNELSTSTKTTIKAPGKVMKLTTSIIYDGNLLESDITRIQNIAATATGFNIERGDLISVEGVQFDRTYEEQIKKELEAIKLAEEATQSEADKYGGYLGIGLRALGGIILLVLISLIISSKRKSSKADKAFNEKLAMDISINQSVSRVEESLVVKPDSKGSMAQKYAKDNPELAADLIKAWIKDW